MKNMVPCKICIKNFEYSLGPAANNKQVCPSCIKVIGEEELDRLEKEIIIEGNRYLMDAPKRKTEYDPIDILVDGNMPEFKSDSDRFVCALEIAFFLKKQKGGFCGMETKVVQLLNHLGAPHNVLLVKQWTIQMIDAATKNKDLENVMKKMPNFVI